MNDFDSLRRHIASQENANVSDGLAVRRRALDLVEYGDTSAHARAFLTAYESLERALVTNADRVQVEALRAAALERFDAMTAAVTAVLDEAHPSASLQMH
ncbi:hypothetical protein [Pararhizobium haloflavum]|uniref:hypothetical protein n=1 Tax=Pararhizobium haloflavum TaxID=2037914 RepID=UPI0012FFEAC8|nr:hypothetical protein [Pararhizobium haloflavum]